MPVPELTLEQLSTHVEDKIPAEHVYVRSKSGSVLRSRVFRCGRLDDAAEESSLASVKRFTCAGLSG